MLANAKKLLPPYLQRRHALVGLVGRDALDHLDGREESTGEPAQIAVETKIDWSSWYLTEEEDVGQSPEQYVIVSVLLDSLNVLREERGWQSVLVGGDEFFAWVESEPLVQVSPDAFLLDDPPPIITLGARRWETWRPGCKPPRFVVEVVSEEWKKDYELNPARYDHLGVSELVIVDADAWVEELGHLGRAPLSVYRRNEEDRLELAYRGRGPAWSREIDAYLCYQQPAADQRVVARTVLRISRSADGNDIVPLAMEKNKMAEEKAKAAEEGRQAAEEGRQAAEEGRQAAEEKAKAAEEKAKAAEERAAAEAAKAKAMEAELAALRALVQAAPET